MKKLFRDQQAKKWIALGGALVILGGIFLYDYAVSPVVKGEDVTVYIPRGAGFLEIIDILHESGIVKNRLYFALSAGLKGVAGKIKPGEYDLAVSMSTGAIIDKLVRGDFKIHYVTIPEDFTVKQIADRLVEENLVTEKNFFSVVTDTVFLASLGINAESAEGYLFPDTYAFHRGMTTREIVKVMVDQFWKKLTPQMLNRAREMGFTIHELVTLASIIGKETGYSEEKTKVSAVFHNRLRKGMRLQCDPTAVYNLYSFQGVVKKKDLDNDTPYNTYKIKGLPPGPIANPGIDSLRAALDPAPVNYFYFVSNNDGTHIFSTSLEAHTQAVLKYQIKRKKQ